MKRNACFPAISWMTLFLFFFNVAHGQTPNSGTNLHVVSATGTGQTTGHIANLVVRNNNSTDLNVLPQTVFIPSGGQYQPYVADIPGTTIPPGSTVTIPVSGYCADVHTPPVPEGGGMPSVEDWIPVSTGVPIDIAVGVSILTQKPLPPFSPADIEIITHTPGYAPKPTPSGPPSKPPVPSTPVPTRPGPDVNPNQPAKDAYKPEGPQPQAGAIPDSKGQPGTLPIPTWPGTDKPVGGTINPVKDPKTFAPVIVEAVKQIERAYDSLKADAKITTPFSGNPEKERESVIQQTFWIYMAGVTGKRYEKENFSAKVIQQFETKTGVEISTLPPPEKEKLDVGIDEFWSTFTAVGKEAKVLTVGPEDSTPGPK